MHFVSTITVFASVQFIVLGKLEAHESNCTSDKIESIDREAFGVTLLQNNMRLQSTSSSSRNRIEQAQVAAPRQPNFIERSHSNLLILIPTCHKHSYRWWPVLQWAQEAHPTGSALLLVGPPPGTVMDKPYEFIWENYTLMVNTSDAYDALAVKMVAGYKAIFEEPRLSKVTYVYKLDDTSIPGDLIDYNITGFNGTQVQQALASQPGDYLTSEFGYMAYDCENIKAETPHLMEWHFKRVNESNYWFNRSQPCDWVFTYANGAFGYILSRRALGLISKTWPSEEAMVKLYHEFVYEDMAIGVTLAREGVKPTPVHLMGHTPWNSHVCPCSPPYPNQKCDSYCLSHETHRCCHTACRDHAGLCTDVVYA